MVEKFQITECHHCGAEIANDGYLLHQKIFCCKACAEGQACDCAERRFFEEERRARQGVLADAAYSE
jgi:hypothetical protein